jgi:hypothetical protein
VADDAGRGAGDGDRAYRQARRTIDGGTLLNRSQGGKHTGDANRGKPQSPEHRAALSSKWPGRPRRFQSPRGDWTRCQIRDATNNRFAGVRTIEGGRREAQR